MLTNFHYLFFITLRNVYLRIRFEVEGIWFDYYQYYHQK